jgi:hypothetical protein
MARKTSAWTQQIRAALRRFSDAGLTEAPAAPQFDWCEHVCVKAFGLEGYAVIHQLDPKQPFGFCGFEPKPAEEHGVGEVLERDMVMLDELPLRVAEWRSFRETTDSINPTSENADHLRWLRAVAVDRKKSLDRLLADFGSIAPDLLA